MSLSPTKKMHLINFWRCLGLRERREWTFVHAISTAKKVLETESGMQKMGLDGAVLSCYRFSTTKCKYVLVATE